MISISLRLFRFSRWTSALLRLARLPLAIVAQQTASPLEPHPLPTTVQATLYGGTGNAEAVNIQRIAGHGPFLYVALTDRPGQERLDVWDVRQPERPRRTSSIDFGSVLTNGVMFVPLALIPSDDGLLLQTRTGLAFYRLDRTGVLRFERPLPDLTNGLGLGMTQLHFAERHGSLLQQVVPNARITSDPNQPVHRQVLVDLAAPSQPRLLWAGADQPSVLDDSPITEVLGGYPASLHITPDLAQVRLRVFETQRQLHRQTFWQPKISRVLAPDALQAPLRDLIARAIPPESLPALQASGLARYRSMPGRADTHLSALILERHPPDASLTAVLNHYGLSAQEPLETAIARLVATQLSADEAALLSADWFAPAFDQWLHILLSPEVRKATLADTRAAITSAFNAELTPHTLVRYLTLHVISPLIGDPAFMRWTLREGIDAVANSEPGEWVTLMLRSCGGFGTLNAVLDRLRDLLDWIPGLGLPHCARYPESTRDLIHLALFSWNGASADDRLDPDGLAWFELLRFYRYLGGQTGFSAYDRDLHDRLATLQRQLGERFIRQLGPAFALDLPDVTLPEAQAIAARQLPSGWLLGRLAARGFIELLPDHLTLESSTPLDAALARLQLRLDTPGRPGSTVADLVAALNSLALASPEPTVGAVLSAAAQLPTATFQSHLEQQLRQEFQAAFHLADLDLPLADLLQPALDLDVDLPNLLGDWMRDLLGELVTTGPTLPEQFLRLRRAFEHRDCIAQWLVTLDAISAATAWVGLADVPLALEYALSEAYSAGIDTLIHALFGVLLSEIGDNFSGNAPLWLASQLRMREWTWTPIAATPGTTTTVLGTCAWQNRVASIVQQRDEANWFGPRQLRLVLGHPGDPAASLETHDLGRWSSVHHVLHHAGALYIGGQHFLPTDTTFPTGRGLLIDLDNPTPRAQPFDARIPSAFATATALAAANRNTTLALAGVDRIFLLPNPAGALPAHTDSLRPPRILQPPTVVDSNPVHTRLQTRASGTGPLEFRWSRNGSPLADATSDTLVLASAVAHTGGRYEVVVSNRQGEARASLDLGLDPALTSRPGFTETPGPVITFAGHPARFTVGVTHVTTPRFQWFHRGQPLPNARGATLEIPAAKPEQAGPYAVEVTDATTGTLLRSPEAHLRVLPTRAPALAHQPPANLSLPLGQSTTLEVQAVGWGPLEYAWDLNGVPLATPLQDPLRLVLDPVTAETTGDYTLTVRDAAGQVTRRSFAVRVIGTSRLALALAPTPAHPAESRLSVDFGPPGRPYQIETSTDLRQWRVITHGVFPPSGRIEVTTPTPIPPSATFYRLRHP